MIHASEQNRPDIARRREAWNKAQKRMDIHSLVFLDETGVNIDMVRRYGRAKGRKRVYDHTPQNKPESITILSSIRLDGSMASAWFSGALTGQLFLEYIRTTLVPTLRNGDIVVMDNLQCHKVSGVKEAIESAGATVCYLPPYSPDLNPIEMLWSKLKSVFRTLKLRLRDSLFSAIPLSFKTVSLSDIAGWFDYAGYSLS